jgi:hypothetical protein
MTIASPEAIQRYLSGGADAQGLALLREIRQDARSDPKPTKLADLAAIPYGFDGGSSALTAGTGGTIEVPFDCRIMGARLFFGPKDGVTSSATVDVRLGTFADYPANSQLYDTIPTISLDSKADLDVTNWTRHLTRRDVLTFELKTFTGSAKKLTLTLWVRKIASATGSGTVTDSASNSIVTAGGDTVTLRS